MPGLGSPSPSPTAAAGQPSLQRSPFPAGWLPSKEQQEKSWLLAGKGSQRQGRAGRESDAFPMLERTILASIPHIAHTIPQRQEMFFAAKEFFILDKKDVGNYVAKMNTK